MATETHGAETAAEAAPGMPQLDFSTFPNQIFWLVVTLVVIYLVLSRVALPRIASVLAERLGTITNDLATAEELKLQAVEAEKAYQQALAWAKDRLQGTRSDGTRYPIIEFPDVRRMLIEIAPCPCKGGNGRHTDIVTKDQRSRTGSTAPTI